MHNTPVQASFHANYSQQLYPPMTSSLPPPPPPPPLPPPLLSAPSYSTHGMSASTSLSSLSTSSLVKIEFDPAEVDFGTIAEGCVSQVRVHMHLVNPEMIFQSSSGMPSLQVELSGSNEWTIEPIDLQTMNKLPMSRLPKPRSFLLNALEKSLSLAACDAATTVEAADSRLLASSLSNRLVIQVHSTFHQFYLRLDTRNVRIARDFDSASSANGEEHFDPLLVQTYAYVYSFLSGSNRRYPLGHIELKVTFNSKSYN